MNKSNVVEAMALRERWTTSDAERVLAACQSSGKSMAAFAREHGLKIQRLSWWRKRLGDWSAQREAGGSGVRFAPAVIAERVSGASVRAVVRLPRGVLVEIDQASPQWVAALISRLCEAAS